MKAWARERLIRKRASVEALLVFALLLPTGCKFVFDRTLSPGQIRGTVIVAPSPGASPVPATNTHVAIENSSIGVDVDSHGNFVIPGLYPGSYTLDLTASLANNGKIDHGLRMANITLAETSAPLGDGRDLGQIEIGAFGGMAGSVVLAGAPAKGSALAVPGVKVVAVPAGAFSLQNLLPGDYTIQAFGPTGIGAGRLTAALPVHVSPREITTVPTIDLSPAPIVTSGAIQGQARLISVPSSQGVTISLAFFPGVAVTNDAQGDYMESGMPAGIFTLTASAPGFLSAQMPATVLGGPPTTLPLITLAPLPLNQPDAGSTVDAGPVPAPPSSAGGSSIATSPNYQANTVTGPSTAQQSSPQYQYSPGAFAGATLDGGS